MKKRIEYMTAYFLFWLFYAVFFKVIFLIYHASQSSLLDADTLAGIFWYGSRLDLAFAAYISSIPFLLVTLSGCLYARKWIRVVLKGYTTLMLIFVTILCTSDLELFRIWGSRLDSSPLLYLNTPKEMFISLGASPIWLIVILNILINLFFNGAYEKLLHPLTAFFGRERLRLLPLYSLAGILLLIPMRGGLQQTAITQSSTYFSADIFANQATLNVPWNFFYSLKKYGNTKENPYTYLPATEADSLLNSLYTQPPGAIRKQLLKNGKPNVVLIIWESLTAKAVEKLGGLQGVTPSFNQLSEEGLLFTRMYASGDRSDKGIVALLSGQPAQPAVSLLKNPQKTLHIPHLSKSLATAGYRTSFYYGGDLSFANLGSYLHNGSFHEIVSEKQFRESERTSKWGVHDHVVLRKIFSDIEEHEKEQKDTPFFKTFFTLSSHEPFDFPGKASFKGDNTVARFLSALHYTDSAVGAFIAEARTKPWYHNTLFIIVADHGHTYPGRSPVYQKRKFHIPMLWLGGALQSLPGHMPHTLSQTDLAASLLGQLNLPADDFRWSRDAFIEGSRPFAPYFFKDGVGLVTDSTYLSFDNVGRQLIEAEGPSKEAELSFAKAYLQQSYGDYLNK